MTTMKKYPDLLARAQATVVQELLAHFWATLAPLADQTARDEHLLCAQTIADARAIVLKMMLALNGIAYPAETRHLNTYLGASQRAAIERTLLLPEVSGESWIGQAVALIVIYRWYAPQLVAAYQVTYPQDAETAALAALQTLPDWPLTITTD